jgi:cytochrome c oxidase subunit IV
MSLIVVVLTAVLIIRKGTGEIQKMRTGLIPLGRLTEKSVQAYKKEKEPWYTPEFIRADRVTRAQLEIYVAPAEKEFRPSSTDKFFNFLVAAFFTGKRTVLWLTTLFPEFIRESPIYRRHTARFRGFLEGYYEPSSTLKSRVVATFILTIIFGIFNPFITVIVIWWIGIGYNIVELIIWAGFIVAIISPWDAYIRQARYHRNVMAWESIIMAPIEGRQLISGTFGVMLAHRFIPFLPASLYLLFFCQFDPSDFLLNLYRLIIAHSLLFTGLSIASGISWQISKRGVTGVLLTVWGILSIATPVFLIREHYFISNEHSLISNLILVICILATGIIVQVLMWFLFDRYTRHPLDRSMEEG